MTIIVAAASAALEKMQAARLPQQNYFGAKEATIFFGNADRRGADPKRASVSITLALVFKDCP